MLHRRRPLFGAWTCACLGGACLAAVLWAGGPALADADAISPPAGYGQAMSWYERAARAGNAQAQFFMGVIAEKGLRDGPDPETAVDWFEKAAQQGHADSQFRLGLAYRTGRGRAADPALAARWFGLAARQGLAEAQFNLARMHELGLGVDANAAQAAILYRRAAEAGLAPAAYNLGLMYFEGAGVPRDDVLAWTWLSKARDRGADGAEAVLKALKKRMTPEDLARARAARPDP